MMNRPISNRQGCCTSSQNTGRSSSRTTAAMTVSDTLSVAAHRADGGSRAIPRDFGIVGIYSASRHDASRRAAIWRGPNRRSEEGSQRKRNTPQSGGWLEIRTRYINYLPGYSGTSGIPLSRWLSIGTFFCSIVTAETPKLPRGCGARSLSLPLQRSSRSLWSCHTAASIWRRARCCLELSSVDVEFAD